MHSLADEIRLSNEDGTLGIEHSVLKLDGFLPSKKLPRAVERDSSPSILFLSSLSQLFNLKHQGNLSQLTEMAPQILLSDEAYRIAVKHFPSLLFLSCHFNAQLSVGNLSLELLPAGDSPGSSMLWLGKRNDDMLFANYWSKKTTSAFRKNAPKRAQTLVLKLRSQHNFAGMRGFSGNYGFVPKDLSKEQKKETERFVELANKVTKAGENLIVPVDFFGEVQRLAARIAQADAQIPVMYCPRVHNVMSSWRDSLPTSETPAWLNSLVKLDKNSAQHSAAIIFISKSRLLQHGPSEFKEGVWVWLGAEIPNRGYTPHSLSQISFAECFALHESPDSAEILTLIQEVRPNQVLICGEGSSQVVHWLVGKGINAQMFIPTKTKTLF